MATAEQVGLKTTEECKDLFHQFIWRIENAFKNSNQQLYSPTFSSIEADWCMEYTSGKATPSETVAIFLRKARFYEEKIFSVTSYIIGKNRRKYFIQTVWHQSTTNFEVQKIGKIFDTNFFRNDAYFSSSGSLVFVCSLQFENDLERKMTKDETKCLLLESTLGLMTIRSDLRKLLESNSYSDVSLKCGGEDFPAHKAILSARSEVFAAMFRSDMSESRKGSVEITDVEQGVLKQLLFYIYTGVISGLTCDSAPVLYTSADKYGIQVLQKECAQYMVENLNHSNVRDILVLADNHSDDQLKKSVISYLAKQTAFLASNEWNDFCDGRPTLGNEVFRYFVKNLWE